ncbi:hypothetical protein TSAR_004236 [Trichomalopsis sarcophagae]|uniref:Uncharacterized protein n=1 Tax=Trichomalopsis sarcophagae TaxID=543379 RepID=A0A232EJX5_9HYME|nr:hypothetical protein TSAR_004236 [Trichomalopsis sarcophagae]
MWWRATELLPCKPADLGSSPGSVTFSLHSSLVTFSGVYEVGSYHIVYKWTFCAPCIDGDVDPSVPWTCYVWIHVTGI